MKHQAKSIRPFIGAKDFVLSRNFYRDMGFEEIVISTNMSLFKINELGFYLQNGYVKDWVDNTMVFIEVDDADRYFKELSALNLKEKYENVRLTPVRVDYWGKECFVHDPSGILWHFGEFFKNKQTSL
ncbi:MAG: glyoxalase [Bacteroidetes bacterium]|jgi:catechol 2,3-dioxygenase-like lactoylglutathione lyase family enzyme|nr:glyoxalase [Bacteroidota bacterium]